jgi:hypothetical protein
LGFHDFIPPSTYLTTGPRFGRIAQWLRYFDADYYRTHKHVGDHSDLEHLDRAGLYRHFIETGWREGRIYSHFLHSFIQPDFYQRRYPELGLTSPQEALQHWMYEGFYEDRIPNEVTQLLLDARIHLFQFGKVGSKAIERALYDAGHDRHVVHLHWPSDMLTTYPDSILSYQEIIRREPRASLTFITGVRDPIERIIAGYFETASSVDESELVQTPVERLGDAITEEYFRADWMELVLGWFEHGYFRDVDVYAYPFDSSAGYSIISEPGTTIFLYKLEDLPSIGNRLSELVGLDLKLQRVNASGDKPYGQLYRAAIDAIQFDRKDVDRVMSSKLVRHFYSKQEIDQMRERWSSKRRQWRSVSPSSNAAA